MLFERQLLSQLSSKFNSGKAIILLGPRQVGKTTLIKNLLKDSLYLFLDGDDPTVRDLLKNANTEEIRSLIGKNEIIFIDEAQRVTNVGLTAKIIIDQIKPKQLIMSGSSSFELNNSINEPLTGRKWEYLLLPISWTEFEDKVGYVVSEQQLNMRLLYGMYPDVLNNTGSERDILQELVSSYLYKDILTYSGIRKPEILEKLLRALAYQLGNEVSYNELSQIVGVDKNTVSAYIDLLTQAFVIFKLPSFSRNLRNEIKKNQKIYFYDLGVRNTIIGDFSPLDSRPDKGSLWENFLIVERMKQNLYHRNYAMSFFWRTKDQQEIDYVEEIDGKVTGFEFKWKDVTKIKKPSRFMETYNAKVNIVHRENFRSFLKKIKET
ncbi:ATP-binding protein [Gangjinia marincola]|uniref:ATP-binding protein n=2 Tax=Gangjinia marincola TaxID=578463 RepID=A0ABP3XQH9_9FLAO